MPLWRASLAISPGDTRAGRELAADMPGDVVERVEERAANSPVAFEWAFTLVLTYALAGRIDDARRAAPRAHSTPLRHDACRKTRTG